MQNVVDVACSSPPVAMNATKPATQAVQAADQDPFGLVLQKASERVVNDRQSDRANKSSDSKSTENTSGSDSTANKKVDNSKKESEVKQTPKAEKADKPAKTDKSEKSEDVDKRTKKEAATDTSAMAFGYINPDITVVDNLEKVEGVNLASSDEIVAEAIQPGNLTPKATTTTTKTEEGVSTPPVIVNQAAGAISTGQTVKTADIVDNTEEQTGVAATTVTETKENQKSKVETKPTIAFSEPLKSSSKIGENTQTDSEPAISNTSEKMAESGKTNVTTSANTLGHEAYNNAGKIQEVASSVVASVTKNEKPVTDSTNPETSPPDTPDGTASVPVQTTSQISESARLAEAPKNEVISQVANQVDQMVKTNRSTLRMQLYPEELGHIDLRIVTTKDGISVTMVTEKASTQQVLKSDMDVLRQNIEQAGIQLTNLNINQGQNSNRQQSFEHRQNFSNNSYPGSGSDNSNSSTNEPKKHLTSTVVDYKV
ncbi:MAG: hypothetical protein C0410_14120 [Anaerolinea sp.]|nr:hypothetical protein [Anaerolinea sp.]